MNLLNLIEDTTTGYDNLRALIQASQSGQDAVLNIGGETVTLDPMETRWIFSKYKAFNKAGRQEEFLNHLADPVKFDQHMKQLRQLIDKQKNFQGSIPGQRGVTGDTMPGQMEEDQAVEEIAMQDPNNMSSQTRGKLNWENMIKDYMGNKPYTEFEFSGDRPLTVYRTQVYAILKAFGSMKPQQKVNTILNTFGDKMATVEYLDKLRAKGLMPKKVPAYIPPGTEPVPAGQMDLPGMATPKIKEAQAQKKNSEITELDRKSIVNPRVARAFQLARARQSAAGSDIEAFVQDELEKSQAAQAEIDQLRKDNDSQDQQMQQLASMVQQQDQEIQQLKQQPEPVVAKAAPEVPAKPAVKPEEPQATEPKEPKAAEKPTEPEVATQPQQQPTDVAQPAPAKKKKAPVRKKAAPKKAKEPAPDTTIQSPPYVELPSDSNVIPIGRGRKKKPDTAVDPMAAAMQGVDIADFGKAVGMNEGSEELQVGDPVIIGGNVEFKGKTGDVVEFGRDKNFVIVDLYNFGKHAFHASNVQYNDYADKEDYVDEDRVKEAQTSMNRFSIAQPPAGGTNKQREAFLNARDRLFRQMQSASPGEKEAIRLKIAELEGQAQSQGIKIRETGEFNRSGYNAIKSLSDWAEKMRTVRELQKDIALMSDPEAKAAVQQRIGDLLKIGIKQGYVKEALDDKAMSVLRSLQQPAPAAVDLNVPVSAEPQMDLATVRKKIAQLDELIRMKEQIDKLFVRAQNARGGIYPGLQSDIEDEELYGVPQTDKDYQILKDKYTKDLAALQKFLAMKKAVYRESEQAVQETSALARLKQARDALSTGTIKESLRSGEYHVATVTLDNGDVRKFKVTFDEGYTDAIKKFYARQGRTVKNIDMDWSIHSNFNEAISKKDLVGRLQKDLPKVTDPKNKDAKPANWTGPGKDDYGYTGYQGHGMPTDKQERARIRADKKKSVAEGLLYSGDTWQDVLYRINVLNDIFGDQKDLAATFEPASQPEWGPFRDQILRSRTVLDTYAKVKQLANMNVPLTDVEIEMLADVAWDGGGGPVEPAGHWGERDYDWLEDLYAQQFAVVQHLLDQRAQGYGQNKTKSGQTVHEQGVAEAPTDYQKRRQRERDVDAGRPVKPLPKNPQTDYAKKRAKDRRDQELGEEQETSVSGAPVQSEKGYFSIWIRKPGADKWTPVVKYPTRDEAEKTGNELKKQGHEIIIREKKDRSPGKITKSEDPCWTGYHMVGKKKKNGREVPNCVPGKKG